MLGNQVELWETMLAAMKLGAVVIPATTLLAPADLRDRIERGKARHVIVARGRRRQVRRRRRRLHADRGRRRRSTAGCDYADAYDAPADVRARRRRPSATDTLLLYFTSGTTARPKLVEHTHASYPVGHLSTMYWIGLQPGDVHLNISLARLGQARLEQLLRAVERRGDAWSIFNYARFDAGRAAGRARSAAA